MRVLVIYPGHSHCTFDVAQGYERALRELGCQVTVYDYHNALAFYQEALRHWQARTPTFEPPDGAALVLASEHAVIEAVDCVPDVVLIVNGMALHRRAFELLHRLGLPLALLLTESPYLDEAQGKIAALGRVRLALTNDKASVARLRQAVPEARVEYLPHSFDPKRHRPCWVGPQYKCDVFFHGTLWPERVALFEPLQEVANGWHVRLSGVDPTITDPARADEALAGLVDNAELASWYNGCKIALNHHRTFVGVDGNGQGRHIGQGEAWSLGPRAFEIAACGAFQLCDDARPELTEIFGDSVATYRDGQDLARQVDYFLRPAHEAERSEMAVEAFNRVQGCTFRRRAEEVLLPALESIGH